MATLEETVAAFELWRSERKNRSERIPERLWSMTKALMPYYKKVEIQKALRVSGGQFNKRCIESDKQEAIELPGASFAMGTFLPKQAVHDEVCELTLKGQHKSLAIKINIQNISSILSLVEQYL